MKALEEDDQDLQTPELIFFLKKVLAKAFHLNEAGMAKLEDKILIQRGSPKFTVLLSLSCYKAIYDEKEKMCIQTFFNAYFK